MDVKLSTGEVVPLDALYGERGMTLVFLRHFGCTFCKEQVARLRMADDLNISFVAMAGPEETETFRQRMHSPHTFICDPEKALYTAFGLGRASAAQVFGPRMFVRGFGATLRGHWVGMPIGDPWQMPGIFQIDAEGVVVWEHRSSDAADNLSAQQVQSRFQRRGNRNPDSAGKM